MLQIVPENTLEAFKEAAKYQHVLAFESDVTVRYSDRQMCRKCMFFFIQLDRK